MDICDRFAPLDKPLAGVEALTAFLEAPQATGIVAIGLGFGPLPRAGNDSSDRTSRVGAFLGAAFGAIIGSTAPPSKGSRVASNPVSFAKEACVGRSSPSSRSSSTVARCDSWRICCSSRRAAADFDDVAAAPLTIIPDASVAIMLRCKLSILPSIKRTQQRRHQMILGPQTDYSKHRSAWEPVGQRVREVLRSHWRLNTGRAHTCKPETLNNDLSNQKNT
jgi:hypothetical protein